MIKTSLFSHLGTLQTHLTLSLLVRLTNVYQNVKNGKNEVHVLMLQFEILKKNHTSRTLIHFRRSNSEKTKVATRPREFEK